MVLKKYKIGTVIRTKLRKGCRRSSIPVKKMATSCILLLLMFFCQWRTARRSDTRHRSSLQVEYSQGKDPQKERAVEVQAVRIRSGANRIIYT